MFSCEEGRQFGDSFVTINKKSFRLLSLCFLEDPPIELKDGEFWDHCQPKVNFFLNFPSLLHPERRTFLASFLLARFFLTLFFFLSLDQVPADFAESHPLKDGWTFWYNQRMSGARTPENYEKHIKNIGTFRSVWIFSLFSLFFSSSFFFFSFFSLFFI